MTAPTTPLPSGTRQLSDTEFVTAIEACTIPNEDFRHYDHVRLAWIYTRTVSCATASDRMVAALRAFAAHHDRLHRYHETMTRVWMVLVAAARPRGGESFDAFLDRTPALRDARLPWRHYSEELLMSDRARAGFIPPDLAPLPSFPTP